MSKLHRAYVKQEIRLGIIGCGMASRRYFELAASIPHARIVATCAYTETSARETARKNGCERWTTDYHELLSWQDIDAVIITTPHALHAPVALEAVLENKHILVEKPFATPSQWDIACKVIEQADLRQLIVMVMPYDRYSAFLNALQYVRPDILGVITAVEADLNVPGPQRSNWYYSREAKGGAGLDTLIYALSRVAAVMGTAKAVTAMQNTLLPFRICEDGGRVQSEVDDDICLLLSYATGQHALVRSCWGYSYATDGLTVHGRYGDIFFNVMWNPPVIIHTIKTQPENTIPVQFLSMDNCYMPRNQHAQITAENALAHFVTCVRAGVTPQPDGHRALHLLEQTCRAYESARSGQTLPLTTSFEPWWSIDQRLFDTRQQYW